MIIDIEACCDIGCVRGNNEDMILVGRTLLRDRRHAERVALGAPGERLALAVADGMGGAAAGEQASAYALERLSGLLHEAPADLDGDELAELLELWAARAHQELLAQGRRDPSLAGMGTTAVGLLLCGHRAWRFHVGDSRLYRLRGGQLQALTLDHSVRQQSGDAGQPSHLLVNSLGGAAESHLELAEIEGGIHHRDRFLLCSDGLHDLVEEARIHAALRADLETAARTLVQMARAAGGRDNISVVVADVGLPAAVATRPSDDAFPEAFPDAPAGA